MTSSQELPMALSDGPTWPYFRRYREALDQLFGLYQSPVSQVTSFLSCVLAVADSSTLLTGMYGTGKTQLQHLIATIFFGSKDSSDDSLAEITCSQDLTGHDVLFFYDLPSLMRGEEVISARDFVTHPLKSVSEAPRASEKLLNELLSLFDRKYVRNRSYKFETPEYLCFLDANPRDSGSSEMPRAFLDRIDFSIEVPTMPMTANTRLLERLDSEDGMYWGRLSDLGRPVLSLEAMQEVWADVRRVVIGPSVMRIGSLVAAYLQACVHCDRSVMHPDFELPCGRCSYRGEVCAKLREVPGSRFLLSAMRLAQARAWLRQSKEVAVDDLLFALPYTLGHRLQLRTDSLRLYPSRWRWLIDEFYKNGIRSKIPRWLQTIQLIEGGPNPDKGLLTDLARRDLATAQLVDQSVKPPPELAE